MSNEHEMSRLGTAFEPEQIEKHFEPEQIEKKIALSLDKGIADGVFPGGITSVTYGNQSPIVVARGNLTAGAEAEPVSLDTIYDLASLTKVVVALPLLLLSVQAGRVSLIDPVVKYLPELKTGKDAETKEKITLYHLLTHTSGLPAWRPFFIGGQGRDKYLQMIAEEAMIGAPGEQAVYSDLGFMLLGFVLERVWDQQLDQLAKQLLFQPCEMRDTTYKPLSVEPDLIARIAPTEDGNVFERGMVVQFLNEQLAVTGDQKYRLDQYAWRQGVIRGTVHDCNAHYGLDGISGHAGLFSTITDLQKYMKIWTDEAFVREVVGINPVLRDFAIRCHTREISPVSRAIGWEASTTGGPLRQVVNGCSGGDLLSPEAYGHTGFTGTSLWHDPARKATIITLTNRVYPTVSMKITEWRRAHHNQIFSLLMPD